MDDINGSSSDKLSTCTGGLSQDLDRALLLLRLSCKQVLIQPKTPVALARLYKIWSVEQDSDVITVEPSPDVRRFLWQQINSAAPHLLGAMVHDRKWHHPDQLPSSTQIFLLRVTCCTDLMLMPQNYLLSPGRTCHSNIWPEQKCGSAVTVYQLLYGDKVVEDLFTIKYYDTAQTQGVRPIGLVLQLFIFVPSCESLNIVNIFSSLHCLSMSWNVNM